MLIGRVAGPFGVRGEIKVDMLTDFPERFRELRSVYVGASHAAHRVEGSRMHAGRILLRLSGLDTPEAADALRGAEIFVPRSQAAVLPPGHFYLEEAIGLAVETTDGKELGPVTDVLKTGSNEVFVVGSGTQAVLIPVISGAIAELDLDQRRVVVEPWVLSQG